MLVCNDLTRVMDHGDFVTPILESPENALNDVIEDVVGVALLALALGTLLHPLVRVRSHVYSEAAQVIFYAKFGGETRFLISRRNTNCEGNVWGGFEGHCYNKESTKNVAERVMLATLEPLNI